VLQTIKSNQTKKHYSRKGFHSDRPVVRTGHRTYQNLAFNEYGKNRTNVSQVSKNDK